MAANADSSLIKDKRSGEGDPFSPESQKAELLSSTGQDLIDRLKACPPGWDHWQDYENICHEILKYSLKDCFENFQVQQQPTTWDTHQRMDIVVKNRPKQGGSPHWLTVLNTYGSQNIVFECKNYEGGIGNTEILQAKDYEIPDFGKYRVILTRVLPSTRGIRAIWHWHIYPPNWKIIVLTDVELIKMLEIKIKGGSVETVFYEAEDGEREKWYR